MLKYAQHEKLYAFDWQISQEIPSTAQAFKAFQNTGLDHKKITLLFCVFNFLNRTFSGELINSKISFDTFKSAQIVSNVQLGLTVSICSVFF